VIRGGGPGSGTKIFRTPRGSYGAEGEVSGLSRSGIVVGCGCTVQYSQGEEEADITVMSSYRDADIYPPEGRFFSPSSFSFFGLPYLYRTFISFSCPTELPKLALLGHTKSSSIMQVKSFLRATKPN